jgi:hypothetical protein
MNVLNERKQTFISPNVQIRPKTFKNVYERSKKEDVREQYSILYTHHYYDVIDTQFVRIYLTA